MNTCDSCKWWRGQSEESPTGWGVTFIHLYGECSNPKVNGGSEEQLKLPNGKYRQYGLVALKSENAETFISKGNHVELLSNHSIPLDQASPEDNSKFFAGPKFGCIQHSEK